jgi:hypothetical protein
VQLGGEALLKEAFGFVDPAHVLRGSHIMQGFAGGKAYEMKNPLTQWLEQVKRRGEASDL